MRQLFKTPEGVSSGELPLSRVQLKTYFKSWNDDVIKALLAFSTAELQKIQVALQGQTAYISDKAERVSAMNGAYERRLHSLFSVVKRQPIHEWYHAVETNNKRVQHVKCNFYAYPAELVFHVKKTGERWSIERFVELGRDRFPLSEFKQIGFMLEREHCYYQLSPKSYDAQGWLQKQDTATWHTGNEEAFELIIHKLSERQVKIERSDNTEVETLEIIPQCQVLLSELSGTFLKLEPQFVYDGIVIDGPFEPMAKVQVQNKVMHIARSKTHEETLIGFLKSLHEKFGTQNNGFFYLTFADAQKKSWFLKTYHLLLEKDIDLLGVDMLRHFRYSPHIAATVFEQTSVEGDFINIKCSVKFGKEEVGLLTLQKAMLNNQKAVMLKDGSLGVLGEEWLQRYGLLVRHGKVKGNELLVARWLMLGEATVEDTTGGEPVMQSGVSKDWFGKWQRWERQETGLYELPAGLQVEALRSYQRTGYEWLRLLAEIGASGCLADDMGLGKTLQTISFLVHVMERQVQAKQLVVAPASLLYNWLMELEKFAPHVNAVVLHGSKRDAALLSDNKTQVIITSYGTLRQDIHLLEAIAWDTIVLDESHHIKNPGAQITKAVWQLSAKTKIALSGTPIMNGTGDLHSQMHFLMPGLLGTPEFFRKEYAIPIEQQANEEKAAVLQRLTRPFILRRTKEQVASDLPEKTESVLWCEMDSEQRAAYESVKEKVKTTVFAEVESQGINKGKLSVLAGLTKLRQLCNSAELVKDEDVFTYDSVKTKVLINELQNIIPQHRALVFSQFTSMLDLLERDLKVAGIPTIRLDGQTEVKKRQALVNQFQDTVSEEAPVFLISLKAGNTGLTLTEADYVFLFDPWWNTAVESQAIDRAHRIGQKRQVFAYRMICRDSVEEKIIKLAARKKKLADDLIVTDESLMKGLSIDDLQYLFE